MRRTIYRWFLRLRFHLLQRHRFNRLVLEDVAGHPFLILPQVFNPTLFLTSEFMVRALDERLVPPACALLDMGTGSGVGAVFAARWAGQVFAVDVNPHAIRCARINVLLNEVEDRVTLLEGDLFQPLAGRRFDVVLFNPPYLRGTPRSTLDRAFHADDVVERFLSELPAYLAPGGYVLLLLSSAGEEATFLEVGGRHGLTHEVVAREDVGSEILTLYRLRPESE